jgi:hypothetical protein
MNGVIVRGLLLVLGSTGCGSFPDEPACASTADCPPGLECHPGSSLCVPADAAAVADSAREPAVPPQVTETYRIPGQSAYDLLIVVDTSEATCALQAGFASEVAALVAALEPPSGAPLDYRIAVTDGTLASSGAFRRGPPPPGSACPSVPGPVCAEFVEPATGTFAFGEVLGPDDVRQGLGDESPGSRLERMMACLLAPQRSGPGVSKGLEAMRLALSCDAEGGDAGAFAACCAEGVFDPTCPGTPAPDFLRPDATLVVVFLSDGDDCSTPSDNPGAANDAVCRHGPEEPDAFADPEFCGDSTPEACRRRECGALDQRACHARYCALDTPTRDLCVWRRDEVLSPVADYVGFLRGIRPNLSQTVVAAKTAGRVFVAGDLGRLHEVTFDAGTPSRECLTTDPRTGEEWVAVGPECCPRGHCVGPVTPACQSMEEGDVFPAPRYMDFAAAVSSTRAIGACRPTAADDCVSYCGSSKPFVSDLVDGVFGVRRVYGYCLTREPACVTENGPCTSTEARLDQATDETVVVCPDDAGVCDSSIPVAVRHRAVDVRLKCPADREADCRSVRVALEAEPDCEFGLAVVVLDPVPDGTLLVVRYPLAEPPRTAVAPDLPVRIPDGDPGGVVSEVAVDGTGRIARLRLDLEILHPNRGDLTVTLEGAGRTETVFEGLGEDHGDDLRAVIDLPAFEGADAAGTWRLRVVDEWPLDTGRLRRWSLEFSLEP